MFNPFAAGKKVYSSGSYAPTRGTVDPSGYIAREMRNQQKKQSQTRSGLASDVLKRRMISTPNPKPISKTINKPSQGSTSNQSFGGMNPLSTWAESLMKEQAHQQHKTSSVQNHVAHRAALQQAVAQNQLPQPAASMQANSNGQLDLPYNSDFAWTLLNAQNDANQQLLQLQIQSQMQALDYGKNKRDAAINFKDLNRHILNQAAARGLAYSSGYGQDVGNAARDYNNYLSDLEQQNSIFNSGADMSRQQIQDYLSNVMRTGALQQAQQLQNQAGNLGYGQSSIDPTLPSVNDQQGGRRHKHHGSANTPYIDRLAGNGLNAQEILRRLAHQGTTRAELDPRQKNAISEVRSKNRHKHYAKTHKKGK